MGMASKPMTYRRSLLDGLIIVLCCLLGFALLLILVSACVSQTIENIQQQDAHLFRVRT